MSIPNGGDISEQMVKVTLDGVEHTIKLLADLAPEILALMKVLLEKSDPQMIAGKTRLVNLLKADPNLSSFTIKSSERKEFEKIADDLKIPFCCIKSKANPEECNVLFHSASKARMNDVLEKFNYKVIDDSPDKKKINHPSEEHSLSSNSVEPMINKKEQSIEFDMTKESKSAGEQFKQRISSQHQLSRDYSPRNQALIMEQKPNASLVMNKNQWKESGRTLTNNAVPMMIYLPRFDDKNQTPREFTKVPVYDIADTIGDPIMKQPYKTEQECKTLITQIESNNDISFQVVNDLPESNKYDPEKQQFQMQKELPKSSQLCLFFEAKAQHTLKDNPHKNVIAMAIAYRLSEKLNIDSKSLDFSRLDETLKGMDQEQVKSVLKEIDSAYTTLSKERDVQEVQKDAPQISAPILKTEKER